MPTIAAFPDVTRAYNRVEINWADLPGVEYARVLRVDVETGECVPLRPYICFFGDYLKLSCGHGIFWDTEVPLDRQIYYITEGLDAPCVPDPDPCVPCTPVTIDTSATPTTMPSNGAFRLRDPVRPCNDLYVPLCFAQTQQDPNCVPGRGIFFASMDVESYDSNTLVLNPTNARRPLAVSRQRRDVASILTLVTRTFDDRDDLLRIALAGSPLMLAGPPQYGIPDRYMSIGDIAVERGVSDHKFPVRVNTMPFVAVDRPAGPSQGVCGSRVDDLCDIYPTINDLEAAGLSWDDLIRGRASNDSGPGLDSYRTWGDVLAEFADWAAVDDGTRTWRGVLEGD